MRIILSYCFVLLSITVTLAQPGRSQQSWTDNYRIAQALLAESSYYNASTYLVRAFELKGADDVDLMYLIAKTYMNARDYDNAAKYFRMTLDHDVTNKFRESRWYYARMLKQAGSYNEALTQFQVLESYTNPKSHRIADEIKGCELALSGKESHLSQLEEVTAINSNYSEYGAMPLKDGSLLYSSLNSNELIYTNRSMQYSKIYQTNKSDGTVVEAGIPLNDKINQPETHNGHGALSDDGRRLYFTRCEAKPDHQPHCKIFFSTKVNGDWSEARELGSNINGRGTSTHPYFSNGKLYFSSDRDGGYGGLDIWVAQANSDGSFQNPQNVGANINTSGDEITPYFDLKEQILYFSSDGHPGYGGFDIFQSKGLNHVFSEPENILYPLNSSADDMYYILDETKDNVGFLTSNRSGARAIDNPTCCDDIFMFSKIKHTGDVNIGGYVYLEGNEARNPIDGAKVELFELDNKGNLKLLDTWLTEDQEPYSFVINSNKEYVIKASKKSYEPNEQQIQPNGKTRIFKDIPIDRDCIPLSGLVFEDDSKNKTILQGAIIRLIETRPNGEQVVLSEAISTIDGYELCAPPNKKMKMIISKDGVLTDSYDVSTIGATDPERFDIVLLKDQLNVGFKIENILYDFNSSILRPESKIELDRIYHLMVLNPQIILEIGSHTDNKGSVDYNVALSQRRAKSAVDYLISKGIPTYRLKSHGYGELQPVAPNRYPDGRDNPDGRQLNRRTEFKIVGRISN